MSENEQNGMTGLMFHYAVDERLTLEKAKEKLRANAYIRTVSEVLERYCVVEASEFQKKKKELQKKVTDILYNSSPVPADRDSIRRKVSVWLNEEKKKTSIEKESVIQLALALKLKPNDAEEMLSLLSDEAFHLRDPEDIVWLFAIEHGLNYIEACGLRDRILRIYEENKGSEDNTGTMTETVKQQISQIQTIEELEKFIASHAPNLGKMHNTAYDLYMHFMELLKDGGDVPVIGGERITIRKGEQDIEINENILEAYLYRKYVPTTKKRLEDAIQRGIKKNWPSETNLSKMTNRETDVTRKVLILLFLACEGGETIYGSLAEESAEDVFNDTYARLSSMLSDCGFPPIDPRNPFDWMVLYCIAKDDSEDTNSNISDFLSEIFVAS